MAKSSKNQSFTLDERVSRIDRLIMLACVYGLDGIVEGLNEVRYWVWCCKQLNPEDIEVVNKAAISILRRICLDAIVCENDFMMPNYYRNILFVSSFITVDRL